MGSLVWFSRVILGLAGLVVLALVVGAIGWITGDTDLPDPFGSGHYVSGGEYMWKTGAVLVALWLVWSILRALVLRHGSIENVLRISGYDIDEASDPPPVAADLYVAACSVCNESFGWWDDARKHARKVHGGDESVLVRYPRDP